MGFDGDLISGKARLVNKIRYFFLYRHCLEKPHRECIYQVPVMLQLTFSQIYAINLSFLFLATKIMSTFLYWSNRPSKIFSLRAIGDINSSEMNLLGSLVHILTL